MDVFELLGIISASYIGFMIGWKIADLTKKK